MNTGLQFEWQTPNVSAACSGGNTCAPAHCTALLCPLTFVAVSDCVKVHVILLVGEEQKAEPGVEGIDGDYEEDPDDVPLFVWRAVVAKVHVDLKGRDRGKGWGEDSLK